MKEMNCREVILYKMYDALANCPEGLPPHPDAFEDELLKTEHDISLLSDEDLVEAFEATVGFWG